MTAAQFFGDPTPLFNILLIFCVIGAIGALAIKSKKDD